MPTLRLQPPSPVFRPSDPTLVRELEDLCRNRIESQEWTRGDVLYVTSDPESQRAWTNLAIGASGKVVRSNGTEPRYSTFTIPDTFTAGSIVYASGANILAALGIGAAGQVMGISNGFPAWQTPSVYLAHNLLSATHSDTTAAAVVRGDIITGQAVSPLWKRLALGAAGALLMSDGVDVGYATTLTGTYTLSAGGTVLTLSGAGPTIAFAGTGTQSITGAVTGTGAWTFSAAGTAVTVTNNVDVNGHMALGANASPASYGVLLLAETGSGDGGSLYGIEIVTTGNAAISVQEAALRVRALTTGAVTIPVVYAGYFDTNVTGATVTNAYGIYIAAVTGATNNYGIRVVPNVTNVLSGWLNVGTTTLADAQGDLASGTANDFISWDVATKEFLVRADTGVAFGLKVFQNSTGAVAHARALIEVNGALSGDPLIRFDVTGISSWSIGVDNSDGDAFKIGPQGGPSDGSEAIYISTASNVRIGVGAPTTGFKLDVIGDLRVSSGLNIGGTVTPADGSAVFTAKASFGGTAEATYVVDALGAAILSGTQASVFRGGVAGTYASAAALTYDVYNIPAHTITITGITQMTAACAGAGVRLGQVTFSDASAVTMDAAATLYIAAAPVGGGAGPLTITNAYSLWVDTGNVRVDDGLIVGGTSLTGGFLLDVTGAMRFTSAPRADYALTAADANLPTFINTPATIPGAQKGWRRINGSAGAQEYVPVWGV